MAKGGDLVIADLLKMYPPSVAEGEALIESGGQGNGDPKV